MPTKYIWLAWRQLRKIWVRVVAIALLAVLAAVVAQWFSGLIPSDWTDQVGATAVGEVLNILATSMLAVTTFSLSIAVAAFSAAATSATPRATALLQEDPTTQNVLATFLGAFLFSLMGIVALKAGYYDKSGMLVLFGATIGVIALVVIALIRWISHLMSFGRIDDTLDRVEKAAAMAIAERLDHPWLDGRPQTEPPPPDARPIRPRMTGHVQLIDMAALSGCLNGNARVWIEALPGSFVHPAATLLHYVGPDLPEEAEDALRRAIVCGPNRNYDQDPRFGLVVLSEIASRALSPAVNDPGTAIDVLGRVARLLTPWRKDIPARISFTNVIVPSLSTADLLDHALRPIARDGAAHFEVQMRLQRVVAALRDIDPATFSTPARAMSDYSLACVAASAMPTSDRDRLNAAVRAMWDEPARIKA